MFRSKLKDPVLVLDKDSIKSIKLYLFDKAKKEKEKSTKTEEDVLLQLKKC